MKWPIFFGLKLKLGILWAVKGFFELFCRLMDQGKDKNLAKNRIVITVLKGLGHFHYRGLAISAMFNSGAWPKRIDHFKMERAL